VTNVSRHGLWLLVSDKEYFLPYEQYPWFQDARIREILNVHLEHEAHLHWPDLDVDLELDSLEHPENYPLIYR
jgi:hypothetical protein